MPDVPLDTLVIIGLVLASLIGRIFQKKKEPKKSPVKAPSSQPPETETSLEEVLKKAFGKPESLEDDEYEDIVAPPHQIQLEQPEEIDPPPPSSPDPLPAPSLAHEMGKEPLPAESPRRKARRELFTTRDSLRKAFVLKEILDKPVSLRTNR